MGARRRASHRRGRSWRCSVLMICCWRPMQPSTLFALRLALLTSLPRPCAALAISGGRAADLAFEASTRAGWNAYRRVGGQRLRRGGVSGFRPSLRARPGGIRGRIAVRVAMQRADGDRAAEAGGVFAGACTDRGSATAAEGGGGTRAAGGLARRGGGVGRVRIRGVAMGDVRGVAGFASGRVSEVAARSGLAEFGAAGGDRTCHPVDGGGGLLPWARLAVWIAPSWCFTRSWAWCTAGGECHAGIGGRYRWRRGW